MKKILIVGNSCSGKSTFAKNLAHRLSLPLYHLDKEYITIGGPYLRSGRWEKYQQDLMTKSSEWIIDGNFPRTLDIRLAEADTVFYFDFSPMVCLFRKWKRFLCFRNTDRFDMPKGVRETFTIGDLLKIVGYSRKKMLERLKKRTGLKVIVFNTPDDVDFYLS